VSWGGGRESGTEFVRINVRTDEGREQGKGTEITALLGQKVGELAFQEKKKKKMGKESRRKKEKLNMTGREARPDR